MSDQDKARQIADSVRRRTQDGNWKAPNPTPKVDPYDVREHTRDTFRGRRADPSHDGWKRVMETYGFRWYPPEALNRLVGPRQLISSTDRAVLDIAELRELETVKDPLTGQVFEGRRFEKPHTQGQWRRDHPTRESFAESDLIGLFGGPEDFEKWISEHTTKARLRRLGLVSP